MRMPSLSKILPKVLIAGGGGLALHGIGSQVLASSRAADAISKADVDPYWLLRLKGNIPLTSKVITDPEEMADHMVKTVKGYDTMSPLRRSIIRRVMLIQAKAVSSGKNAAYAGTTSFGRPVFLGGKLGMNAQVASHETGHYRADKLRPAGGYSKEYERAATRIPHLSDILERNMWEDAPGVKSRPGLEREAWDLAPKHTDSGLRDVALDSYKRNRTGSAEYNYGIAAAGTGVALKLLRELRKVR